MASLFDKDPNANAEPTVYDRIGSEISHLKKGASVRDNPAVATRKAVPWFLTLVIFVLVGLYVLDPFLYAYHKYEATSVYLYLHNYDSASKTDDLVGTGLFSTKEIATMDEMQGTDRTAFASVEAAEAQAADIVDYINRVHALHAGKIEQLDFLGKIRCYLFVKTGLQPPISWSSLNPGVK